MRVLYVTNPVAGKKSSQSILYETINEFCKANYDVTVKITQYRGHAVEIAETAKKEGYDILVCCGGDGTLNEILTGLIKGGPIPLGYIPAGSTNDFAETLGLSLVPQEAAYNITQNRSFSVDAGEFTVIEGETTRTRNFSYIASFGAFSAASYEAPQPLKNTLGHFAYILQGIKDIKSIKGYKATVTADGETFTGDYIIGAISNTTSVGGIFKLGNFVDLTDGLFEMILVKVPKDIMDVNKIIEGITTSNYESDVFVFKKVKEITLQIEEPFPWTLDGEKEEGGKQIHIKNLHNAVTLLK